ncbi:hypothetical protein GOODEAATRI_000103 [Goodea atripinnis]|uniref:Uncharacterized protein n=1 Tax=Goodea atripinnis TaxID=208336 RepID=A0ABV0P208_9TELE
MFMLALTTVDLKTPGPVAISAVLDVAGGPFPPPALLLFLLRSILKTTFMYCNSYKLLIGGDEFVTESGVMEGSPLRAHPWVFGLYERVRVFNQRHTTNNCICLMCGHV